MSILGTITSFVSGIFKPAADLIDDIHTSEEEKGEIEVKKQKLRNEIDKAKFTIQDKLMEYESKLMENRTKLIEAEARDGNLFTKSWRPAVMIVFTILIITKWLGFSAEGISPEIELELFAIVKLGLGGYVIGRSAEKVVKTHKKEK